MKNKKSILITIIVVSVAVPALVSVMLFSPYKISLNYSWIDSIPGFNAFINSLTVMALIVGKRFAILKEYEWHRIFMGTALGLGVIFLLSYVVYHASSVSAVFGDSNLNGVLDANEKIRIGNLRTFYLGLLLSHIAMSSIIIPFVLTSFYYALTEQFEKHVRSVKYTWPMWMYVSVTGVIVYFMAYPYYPN